MDEWASEHCLPGGRVGRLPELWQGHSDQSGSPQDPYHDLPEGSMFDGPRRLWYMVKKADRGTQSTKAQLHELVRKETAYERYNRKVVKRFLKAVLKGQIKLELH